MESIEKFRISNSKEIVSRLIVFLGVLLGSLFLSCETTRITNASSSSGNKSYYSQKSNSSQKIDSSQKIIVRKNSSVNPPPKANYVDYGKKYNEFLPSPKINQKVNVLINSVDQFDKTNLLINDNKTNMNECENFLRYQRRGIKDIQKNQLKNFEDDMHFLFNGQLEQNIENLERELKNYDSRQGFESYFSSRAAQNLKESNVKLQSISNELDVFYGGFIDSKVYYKNLFSKYFDELIQIFEDVVTGIGFDFDLKEVKEKITAEKGNFEKEAEHSKKDLLDFFNNVSLRNIYEFFMQQIRRTKDYKDELDNKIEELRTSNNGEGMENINISMDILRKAALDNVDKSITECITERIDGLREKYIFKFENFKNSYYKRWILNLVDLLERFLKLTVRKFTIYHCEDDSNETKILEKYYAELTENVGRGKIDIKDKLVSSIVDKFSEIIPSVRQLV